MDHSCLKLYLLALRYSVRPNIKGGFNHNVLASGGADTSEDAWTGAINTKFREVKKITYTDNTLVAYYGLYFNASKSNPIYSDSVSTVRPEAFRILALVRAY